ncbi:Endonuclease domain-containing 1 protein [Chelonia mydas]|uniref:Endonuclease domain-containing 1 protein n=1 Tax=Chelonia mydas TaxID=8469 RepID=M7B1W4_CHEMY|nr:Endonuclease domain-containing 1 protein [Chelonia mydas]
MDLLMLLGCVSLWVGLALAEVGSFRDCRNFFYQRAEPQGLDMANTAEICQKYHNLYYFATLYDRANRIPCWSAYKLGDAACPGQAKKMSQWFVEPQCNDGRTATFTLTNAAPMDPCFNRIHCYRLEETLKTQLTGSCGNVGGTPYLVTGAVPSDSKKIPIEGEDKEGDRNRPYNRVSVPTHVWTAVCCDHWDNNRKFSFAFIGENKEASSLQIIPVEQLNTELSHLYKTSEPVEVFADDCGSRSQKGQQVLSAVKKALYNSFQNFLIDSYSQLLPPVKRSKLDRETTQVMTSTNLDQNKMQLTSIGFLMGISNLTDWHSQFENTYKQDNLACVLAPAVAGVAKASGISDRVCTLQEQKHLPNSSVTAKGWSCVGQSVSEAVQTGQPGLLAGPCCGWSGKGFRDFRQSLHPPGAETPAEL